MTPRDYSSNKFAVIDSLPLFLGLSVLQKYFISKKAQIVEFKKGETIYKEGDRPDYFYCMVTGRVEIYHPRNKTKNHKEFLIERVRKGDYFGSISSLTGQPHTVSTRVLNDSVLLRIDTKSFNLMLRKIPGLALVLSHSLSRRLGRKGKKEIFESTIISLFSPSGYPDPLKYASDLAMNLKKESSKKVMVLKSSSIRNKKEVSAKLSSLTAFNHYVLVPIQGKLSEINFEILKQSDISHILSPSDKISLSRVSAITSRLKNAFSENIKHNAHIILEEGPFYKRIPYSQKCGILAHDVFATLPTDKPGYKKAMKRIARKISGVGIGLALGSGAAMGLAHIGVLKVLEEEKIPIDAVSATSIGALVGALWAAGYTSSEIAKLATSFKGKLRTLFLADPTFPVRGLIKGRAVRRILKGYLGNKTFFDIKLPLKIVACDIKKRKEYIIDNGSLVDAVMASIAIPGVFEPRELSNGIQLVDGGIVNPVPVNVLSRDGIKRIIASNVLPSPEDIVRISRKRLNIYDIIVNSFQAMEYTIAEVSSEQADVHIHPIPRLADWYEFYKAELFIKTGREHTKKALPQLKSLLKRQ